MRTVIEGYRTRLRAGSAARYREVHATIPDALAAALRDEGLISWRIWIDGETLFHAIETRHGKQAMVDRMTARGPVDPVWDELVAGLVDDDPAASRDLDLVWALGPRPSP